MSEILTHTEHFRSVTSRLFKDLFDADNQPSEPACESASLSTDRSVLFSVQYTGTVYGEYALAMDPATAQRIVHGDAAGICDVEKGPDEETLDALCEVLNMIVGDAIQELQRSHAKLTLTSPRVMIGKVRYPAFQTGRANLDTAGGSIECHFCLDRMRLDLATSYQDAVESLTEVNESLRLANQHLAEQQAQLVHTEKMASVGILASGVAHEINNPLFFVDSNLHTLNDYVDVLQSTIGLYDKLCQSSTEESLCADSVKVVRDEFEKQDVDFVLEDTKHLMTETREGVQRIKSIVESLKDFSQVDRGGVTQTDLNIVIENTLTLIRSEIPDHCNVETQLSPLPTVACNVAEIGQVIAGVILNAAQAVDDEGSISIHSDLKNDQVVVRIVDDGCGIDDQDLHRLFDPFFSTKTNGEHAGLGLSIAYGVVQKHGGAIQFRSQLGQGTEVTLRLPTVKTLSLQDSDTVAQSQ